MSSLWEQFAAHPKLEDCPIYDMHGHWGPFKGAYLPASEPREAMKYLDRAGVEMFVFSSHQALYTPDIGNESNIRTARDHPGRMRAYCCVNPQYPRLIERDLAGFDANRDVYAGFKMHPPTHGARLTDDAYRPVWEFADANGLVVLSHTWGNSDCCGHEQVREVASRYPGAKIIAGHSIHGDWDQAIELANDCANVYLDTCAVLDDRGVIERFVAEVGSERILFGTDFPWFSYHYYIGAVLGAAMSDEDRRIIFYRNARKLLSSLSP